MTSTTTHDARPRWLWAIVRRVGLIPIWLLTLALKPALPQTHPWKHQAMTLQSWWDRGTDNAVAFGWCFIVNIGCILALLPRLFA